MWNPSQSYGASPAVWDHTVVTCHPTPVNAPRHNLSRTGWYSIFLPRRDGRLSWPWCSSYTEMVYLSTDSHPSSYYNRLIATRPGVELTTSRSQVQRPHRCIRIRLHSGCLHPIKPIKTSTTYSSITVHCMHLIIFLCVAVRLFSVSFVAPRITSWRRHWTSTASGWSNLARPGVTLGWFSSDEEVRGRLPATQWRNSVNHLQLNERFHSIFNEKNFSWRK